VEKEKHSIYYKQERGQKAWLQNTKAWETKANEYIITKNGRFPSSFIESTTTTFGKSLGIYSGSTSPSLSNDTKNAQLVVINNNLVEKLHLMNFVFKGPSLATTSSADHDVSPRKPFSYSRSD